MLNKVSCSPQVGLRQQTLTFPHPPAQQSVSLTVRGHHVQQRAYERPSARTAPVRQKDVGVCRAAQQGNAQAPKEEVTVDSVDVLQVAPDVQMLRGVCKGRLKYEVEYALKHGTTDNCYLIQAENATVLIDLPFESYATKFVEALTSLTPAKKVTHLIITQLDPKSIPTLELLLKAIQGGSTDRKMQVILSNPALRLLQSALGENPEKAQLLTQMQLVVARSGGSVSLSDTQQLQILLTPTPRWPDLMVVYHPGSQLLFTSKLFSAHVAPPDAASEASAFDVGGYDVYGDDWRYFFDCMLAPVAKQAAAALEKLDLAIVPRPGTADSRSRQRPATFLKELMKSFASMLGMPAAPQTAQEPAASNASSSDAPLVVSSLCPMHGPVVSTSAAHLLREYNLWTADQVRAANTSCVLVLYASAYGNTAALAQAISRGVTKAGVAVNTLNLEYASLEDVTAALERCDGFVLGSPTLGGHMPTQVQVCLGAILRDNAARALPCGVFGSFGWSGEAVDEMEGRLSDAGFSFAFTPIRVKFKPTAKDLLLCEESGRDLAVSVKKKLKNREVAATNNGAVRTALASGAQLAMGRVLGSLSVITARDEDASGAMLASWISQASFDPPGITVSVKKDRAMEAMLVVGSKFSVSMVPEGADRLVMRKLAKPFAPGEERLAGLETIPSETTGALVLKSAHSYLDCQVVSRMEAGDHWVVYASVLNGKVTDETALTAVHHRKVGNHY